MKKELKPINTSEWPPTYGRAKMEVVLHANTIYIKGGVRNYMGLQRGDLLCIGQADGHWLLWKDNQDQETGISVGQYANGMMTIRVNSLTNVIKEALELGEDDVVEAVPVASDMGRMVRLVKKEGS